MGIFDSIQNLIGGASDLAQGSIGDALGGLGEIPGVQEIQDVAGGATEAVTSATDGVTEAITSVTEQGQTAVEDIAGKFGL
ncbi:hypothetical protein KC874_05235 [Candidatus Saccharibacteria bacterium]|nr:hypothetical protein [Candidatus Saccharibacteria bacterium]